MITFDQAIILYVKRNCKTVGQRIRFVREALGLSQDELAARSGLTRITIGKIERGRSDPKIQTFLSIADALGIVPSELLPEYSARDLQEVTHG